MRHNALRRELAEILTEFPLPRKPAIRRSLTDEWLYAADLPGYCGDETVRMAEARLRAAGWTCERTDGWLMLMKPSCAPPEDWFEGPFGPQAASCASLLRRHPARDTGAGERAQHILIRAGEEGAAAYEEACAQLHAEWAERLRKGKNLPGISPRYFGE